MRSLHPILVFAIVISFVGLHASFAISNDNYNTTSPDIIQQTNANSIQVNDSNFVVNYSITNGTILNMHGDNQSRSVVIHTKTTGSGILTITLPRELIDSKTNGADDKFFVTIDGQEESFDETKTTDSSRTLNIAFGTDTQEIDIFGTKAVPEFGNIPYITLAIPIMFLTIFYRKIKSKIFS
ncbi:MAG: hypothetical protein KGH76_05160 [Thaumarchaeota archaeon]|nr:hypothetical protein [Nitrososphaerota archaeon]MDE1842385.1 hypothetical protein [Nitrososphaerota archaeon]